MRISSLCLSSWNFNLSSKTHWFGLAYWEMAKHVDNKVRKVTKIIVQNVKFLFLMWWGHLHQYVSWASVCAYIVQHWCCIPLLLNVKYVLFRFEVDNLTLLITNFLMTQGGLKKEKFASRLVCFGVDGSVPSKAWDLELQFKSNDNILHLSLVCMVWLIKEIWKYKLFQTFFWCFTLKVL
jgi:hypothetical protein